MWGRKDSCVVDSGCVCVCVGGGGGGGGDVRTIAD